MSVNKVILLGHVGKDPEVKVFDSGSKVAQLTLATTEKGYTLQNGTQVPDRTEWHNLVIRNKLADIAEQYIKKGDKLYCEGKIRTRSYDDASGVKRYITEVHVDVIELLGIRRESVDNNTSTGYNPNPSQPDNPVPVRNYMQGTQSKQEYASNAPQQSNMPPMFADDAGSDLPF